MTGIGIIVAVFVLSYLFKKSAPQKPLYSDFLEHWREILQEHVVFYKALSPADKLQFENRVLYFLNHHKIRAVQLTVSETDKLLIAASAIIPIFAFPDWYYPNIKEIILYPKAFNNTFKTTGKDRNILGVVGEGFLKNKMILSRAALYHGFTNETDKGNTAIHEFIHLLDMMDGAADGIPKILLKRQYILPWLDLIDKKIHEINKGKSDIRLYGGTNRVEFFAVISEYFFERPKLLAKKHPELYRTLEQIFKQKMKDKNLNHYW